jgi:hypothetical protein
LRQGKNNLGLSGGSTGFQTFLKEFQSLPVCAVNPAFAVAFTHNDLPSSFPGNLKPVSNLLVRESGVPQLVSLPRANESKLGVCVVLEDA